MAEHIGSSTYQVVAAILTSKRAEQQSYRSCMGLLKLADNSIDRLEAACRKALSFTATPSYKSIKNILDTGSGQMEMPNKRPTTGSHTEPANSSYALTSDDSPLSEAVLDRIKHDTYKIDIIPTDSANHRSMRKVYRLDPALSE